MCQFNVNKMNIFTFYQQKRLFFKNEYSIFAPTFNKIRLKSAIK